MRRSDILSSNRILLLIIISAMVWILWFFAGDAAPAEETLAKETPPKEPAVTLHIQPVREIYSSRDALAMILTLTARNRTKLCLEKDPASQVQFTVMRSGTGKLPVKPLIIRDIRPLLREPMQVRRLAPGERFILRMNLKRVQFEGAEQWAPGEYGVRATFQLCEQTFSDFVMDPGRETPIPSENQARFMIAL